MSLPRRERRALLKIEAGLSRSDPRLAKLLGDFCDQAGDGQMPASERAPAAAPVAVRVLRMTRALAAFVLVPGLRERLAPRGRAQPMGRLPGQRFT